MILCVHELTSARSSCLPLSTFLACPSNHNLTLQCRARQASPAGHKQAARLSLLRLLVYLSQALLHGTLTHPCTDSEPMSGVQFSALNQGSLPLSVRMHRRNRFGLRPPPPTQRGSTNRFPRLDLSAVNVGLIGAPTLAPENTPAPSNAPSDRSRPGQGLPTIEEALERLPELSSDM